MSNNKSVRKKLEALYGEECWIEKLHLRPPDDPPRHYKSSGELRRMKQITYHHIQPKSKGGKATIENGALLSAENHRWFHQQPLEIQNKLNKIFQEYKASFPKTSSVESPEIDYDKFITKAKNHYDRSKMKRETQKLIDEMEL